MRWITASQLENWARGLGSRTELPGLVADLIRATAPDIAAMRFPSGDKGQVRGFDGHLESAEAALHVPAGRSIWEFGTSQDYETKALADFRSRTADVAAEEQAQTTLVLVTPWAWDKPSRSGKREDWIAARRREAYWKHIEVLDGSALEDWLARCPAAAAWHAHNTLRVAPLAGARSTDEYWSWFSGRFGPPLTEDVLLCGRSDASKSLLAFLQARPDMMSVVADSPDEAVAFAIATIRKASPAERLFLEARTLVLDTAEAGRYLVGHDNLIFLVRGEAAHSPRQLSLRAPVLVPLGRQPGGSALVLDRPSSSALGTVLETMLGVGENEAHTLARGCGRSLTALARLKPGGRLNRPPWLDYGSDLTPLILAGAWDANNAHDRAALSAIVGQVAYDGLETLPRRYIREEDPPFDREGSIWKIRAPMDAFVRIGPLIDAAAAARLRDVMIAVFGTVKLPDEASVDFFSRAPDGHSEWLREGLATTLLLLAAWGTLAEVDLGGEDGQTFANRVFNAIPRLREDYRIIESLRDELPILAEAAPNPFLAALESVLKGDDAERWPLFAEQEGLLSPSPRFPHLLWALEVLAWDPSTFRRAVLIIARLAAIDPGGQKGGRPLDSLREIFLLWNPNTNASPTLRWAVLDELIRTEPIVGWELVARLLPVSQDSSRFTSKPRLREAGASDRKPVTRGEYAEGQDGIVDRAIVAAGDNPDRWKAVIGRIGNFSPARREAVASALVSVLPRLGEADRLRVWVALRDEVARHESYASANWALPTGELATLKVLVAAHGPADPVIDAVHRLDTWTMDEMDDRPAGKARRVVIVRDLYANTGAAGIVRLGCEVRLPHQAIEAFAEAGFDDHTVAEVLDAALARDIGGSFTLGVAGLVRQRVGGPAAEKQLSDLRGAGAADAGQIARILMSWPDGRETWASARRLGTDVENAYWNGRNGYFARGDRRTFLRAVAMLLRHGRAIVALDSVDQRLGDTPTRALLRLLEAIVAEINTNPAAIDGTMLTYHVERVLAELDGRPDVTATVVGAREFALLPLLRQSERPLQLHALMANDPALFSAIVANVYRGEDEPESEIDEARRSLARLSYTLLSECAVIPGFGPGKIDGTALGTWIDAVRATGAATGRVAVTEISIGRLLAHAPADADGGWPDKAVREQIERLASDDLERQIQIERFNMRGGYSKALYEGGRSERELAESYRGYADRAVRWPRTCELLRTIARNWDRDAEAEDIRAAQDRLRS